MRSLLAAAAVAAAFPGSALGAGLVERAVSPQAPSRPVQARVFDLVGAHWRGPGLVKYRTRNLAGRWSAWRLFSQEDSLPDRGGETRTTRGWRVASPFWTGSSNGIQYRTVGRVSKLRGYLVRSPRERMPLKHADIAGAPPIITRAGWQANEAIKRAQPYYADSVHLAIVHHTAGSNSYTKAQSAAIVRAIELYHVKGNGWNDIGYNFLVDKYGQIFEGRYGGVTRPVIGAHSQGFNSGSVGIAVIGDYGSTAITPAARAALVSLIAWRLDLDHVDPLSSVVRVSAGNPRYAAGKAVTLRAISGHRDVYPTSCPGASLYPQLASIRSAVAQTGLPKLYAPAVVGALGGPVRFTARLSSRAAWAVTVRAQSGAVVASGSGTGSSVDWTWNATTAPMASYTWTISAPQARPATGTIGTAPAALAVQQLKLAPPLVTPNGDRSGDTVKVSYRLTAPAVVIATVLDGLRRPVATIFNGRRPAGAQAFVWSRVTVPDGRYSLALVAKDTRGKQVQATAPFTVDRTFGVFRASAPAYSPNGDGRMDSVSFTYSVYGQAHVRLEIARGGVVVATPAPDALVEKGTKNVSFGLRLPDGRYSAILTLTDSTTTAEQSLPLTVDTKPPVLRLVSLGRLLFRVNEPGRVVLAVNGRWRRVDVKRPGLFHIAYRGRVRSLTAYATDAAGNRGAMIRARR